MLVLGVLEQSEPWQGYTAEHCEVQVGQEMVVSGLQSVGTYYIRSQVILV